MKIDLPKGMDSLTLEDFSSLAGAEFEIDSQPVLVSIRLDEVTPLSGGPSFLTRQPFRLVWSSAPTVSVLTGIYWVRRRDWGPHQVYLEPLMPYPDQRLTYQSSFF